MGLLARGLEAVWGIPAWRAKVAVAIATLFGPRTGAAKFTLRGTSMLRDAGLFATMGDIKPFGVEGFGTIGTGFGEHGCEPATPALRCHNPIRRASSNKLRTVWRSIGLRQFTALALSEKGLLNAFGFGVASGWAEQRQVRQIGGEAQYFAEDVGMSRNRLYDQ
jgi:hypothetical protein